MSATLTQIAPPAAEPVTIAELKGVLRLDAGDTSWDATLLSYLVAARTDYESWSRMRLITQTWLLRSDSFPGISFRYDRGGYPQLALPLPPFQSVDFMQYVDTAGAVQTLTRDTTYGNEPPGFYSYQLQPGGGIQPATLIPNWARPWPPQRLVPANTLVQFRCGYGGPITVSIEASSKVLAVDGFTFNPDDAPQMPGETGTRICIAGAGADGADLETFVASVDSNGVATLKDAATATVSEADGWLGRRIPQSIKLSILFQAQFFFEQGAVTDQELPRVVMSLRGGQRNLAS